MILYNENFLVCNAFMASAPAHPYWPVVFDEIRQRRSNPDPPLSTGPRMLQAALDKYHGDKKVRVLDSRILYPVYDPYAEIPQKCKSGSFAKNDRQQKFCDELAKGGFSNDRWPEAFAEHHWAHTWFGAGETKYASEISIQAIVSEFPNKWKVSVADGWVLSRSFQTGLIIDSHYPCYSFLFTELAEISLRFDYLFVFRLFFLIPRRYRQQPSFRHHTPSPA